LLNCWTASCFMFEAHCLCEGGCYVWVQALDLEIALGLPAIAFLSPTVKADFRLCRRQAFVFSSRRLGLFYYETRKFTLSLQRQTLSGAVLLNVAHVPRRCCMCLRGRNPISQPAPCTTSTNLAARALLRQPCTTDMQTLSPGANPSHHVWRRHRNGPCPSPS
jgi:hypothetical protein